MAFSFKRMVKGLIKRLSGRGKTVVPPKQPVAFRMPPKSGSGGTAKTHTWAAPAKPAPKPEPAPPPPKPKIRVKPDPDPDEALTAEEPRIVQPPRNHDPFMIAYAAYQNRRRRRRRTVTVVSDGNIFVYDMADDQVYNDDDSPLMLQRKT